MAYKQYTSCRDVSGFSPLRSKVWSALAIASIPAWIAVLITIATKHPLCAFHAALILLYFGTLYFCDWWLNFRLVCLGDDKCAIGLVLSIETVADKTNFFDKWDTDFSINLLLANTSYGVSQPDAETSVPFGNLIAESGPLKARTDISFTGQTATTKTGTIQSAILHAECEGAGGLGLVSGHHCCLDYCCRRSGNLPHTHLGADCVLASGTARFSVILFWRLSRRAVGHL
jgi:hypothetical protein